MKDGKLERFANCKWLGIKYHRLKINKNRGKLVELELPNENYVMILKDYPKREDGLKSYKSRRSIKEVIAII